MYISNAVLGKHLDDEIKMYQRVAMGPKSHPGRQAIRSLLDSFDVHGLKEPHRCLVHPPLGDNLSTFLQRNPVRRLPKPILAFVLYRLFLALDYLHRECQIIHTGLRFFPTPLASTIMPLTLNTGHRYQTRQHYVFRPQRLDFSRARTK
jgi:serine/threonine-protein kinase SRPK3